LYAWVLITLSDSSLGIFLSVLLGSDLIVEL
jgi:hypothetical protein